MVASSGTLSGPPASDAESARVGDSQTLELTFDQPGVYNVQLEVRDAHGAVDYATVPVLVGNSIPQVRFVYPRDGDFFDAGTAIEYQVEVTDSEDGTSSDEVAATSDLDILDPSAPDRVLVQSRLVVGSDSDASEALMPPGLKLMRASDCFNCHATERAIVGPSFVDIATKYRDQLEALEKSIERVRQGSTGVWGKVAMLPHSQHTLEQVREMVTWVYAVKPDPNTQQSKGFSNRVTLLEGKTDVTGALKLTASYRDLGRDSIPPLFGTASIELKPRTIQAERASHIYDMAELGSHRAGDGKFLGAINHGSFLRLDAIPMDQVGGITVSVTSAGSGGEILIHSDAKDGPILGKIPVEVNGDWDAWYERTLPVSLDKQVIQVTDIYLEFVNERNRGGLMNIDWVRFEPK
jgi:cytochrome c